MTKRIAALLATLALTSPPLGAAEFASPEGIWEIEMRDSRYAVEMCGENGDALCGTLIWLGGGADNAENRPYLNTLLIDHAPRIDENRWQGTLHLFGQTATGTITQVSDDEISLEGCFLLVFCRTYQMYRYE